LLEAIDQIESNRSAFIERASRVYLARMPQARDIQIINANADRLNAEAADVLGYQRSPRK
jgi:hypothetical protein